MPLRRRGLDRAWLVASGAVLALLAIGFGGADTLLDVGPVFAPLPWRERLFVWARLQSAPLREVVRRAPPGDVADVGCGHGLVTALLAEGRPDRRVVGVDPDVRKLQWARRGPGRLPNVELLEGGVETLARERTGALDAVVVCDVLYLLPFEKWRPFLESARALLRPGGSLLLKEAEADGSWRYRKCLAQEVVMVRLLRRTQSSGGLGFKPRAVTQGLLREAGFQRVETLGLARGYSIPHVLFVAVT